MRNEILSELNRRQSKVEAKRPELLLSADIRRQRKHGPDYGHRAWWGPTTETERRAIRRAIERLKAEGLITTRVQGERRISNLKLTDAGRKAVSHLGAA